MKRNKVGILCNILLILWYSLSLIGIPIGEKYLVEKAPEEWIFLVIPVLTFTLSLVTKKTGRIVHFIWLIMWFVTQFLSHEWYTLFGKGFMGQTDAKIEYFKNCIQIVEIPGRYVPDVYHVILHILIIVAIASLLSDWRRNHAKNIDYK